MSQFEDTTVDELKVGDYSDEQLKDIAENDTRSTAREAAEAEINRRENDNAASDDSEIPSKLEDLPDPPAKLEEITLPNGEKSYEQAAGEDAGFVRDSTGEPARSYGELVGAGQVQHKVDQANASGHFPADGSPPSGDHTVAAVTGNSALQDLADKGGTASEDAAGFDNTGS